MALMEDLLDLGHNRVHLLGAPGLNVNHVDDADNFGRAAERARHGGGLIVDGICWWAFPPKDYSGWG